MGLDELLRESDLVSLHCPLTPETHHLIDRRSIAGMKPGVMLINTSRGGLIDTGAVIDGLKSGRIGHLGLDVYEEEARYFYEDYSTRLIDDDALSRLLTFPNVIVTSHQGFFTREALEQIARTTLGNVRDFEEGRAVAQRGALAPGRAERPARDGGVSGARRAGAAVAAPARLSALADQVLERRQRRLGAVAGRHHDLLVGDRGAVAGGEHAAHAGAPACVDDDLAGLVGLHEVEREAGVGQQAGLDEDARRPPAAGARRCRGRRSSAPSTSSAPWISTATLPFRCFTRLAVATLSRRIWSAVMWPRVTRYTLRAMPFISSAASKAELPAPTTAMVLSL